MSDGSHVILLSNDNQMVFLIKRTDYPVWDITGGGVEEAETPKEAALREAKEETSFEIEISDLIIEYEIVGNNDQVIRKEYLYEGYIKRGEYTPEFTGNIGRWFQVNNLPLSVTKATKRKISDLSKYSSQQNIIIKYKRNFLKDNLHLMILHPIFTIKNLRKILKKSR